MLQQQDENGNNKNIGLCHTRLLVLRRPLISENIPDLPLLPESFSKNRTAPPQTSETAAEGNTRAIRLFRSSFIATFAGIGSGNGRNNSCPA